MFLFYAYFPRLGSRIINACSFCLNMDDATIKKSNFQTLFVYPLVVTVVGGLFVIFIQKYFPGHESVSTVPSLNEEKYTREPFSYYSWSYQRIGYSKIFVLFSKWKPVYNIQMKIGYIGENPENIEVFIPINGKIRDISISPNIESTTKQKDNNYLSILFHNVKPGSIIAFSFHVKEDIVGEPIKKDLINVYNGKTKLLNWDTFDYEFNIRNEGFFKYLFK